jgi:hypothetical protein
LAETVVVPWYATGLRADAFAVALNKVAAAAMRYGASSYAVYRSQDDLYRFQQFATFAEHLDWERYWEGPEMIEFRTRHSGWYQVPVLYGPWERTVAGGVQDGPAPGTRGGNGRAHGVAPNGGTGARRA